MKAFRTVLLTGTAVLALSSAAFAQGATTDAPKKHRHHVDRLDLLEQQLQQQAAALKEQSAEIQQLKSQLGQQQTAAAPAQVTPQQFAELQNKVDQVVTQKAEEKKDGAIVEFRHYTPYQHSKTVPTIASADGRYTFQPFILLQGDWGSYSKSQPLSQAGTNNLKSSGENFRRARIGFQGIFDKDFSYSFIADFGGSGGDESYQAYAAPNSGTTKNASGATITPLTTSNGARHRRPPLQCVGRLQGFPRSVHVQGRRHVDARQSGRHDAIRRSSVQRTSFAFAAVARARRRRRPRIRGLHRQRQLVERFAVPDRRYIRQSARCSHRQRPMAAARKPFSVARPSGPGTTKLRISTSIWAAISPTSSIRQKRPARPIPA